MVHTIISSGYFFAFCAINTFSTINKTSAYYTCDTINAGSTIGEDSTVYADGITNPIYIYNAVLLIHLVLLNRRYY